ncbi:MAG: arginine--tRNA ligase [Candidatus Micrarchaeia archaeon]
MILYAIEVAERQARELVEQALSFADFEVSEPKHEAFGDLSSNACFMLARKLGKSPQQTAAEAAQKISRRLPTRFLESVSAAGGYLNFKFSNEFFVESLKEVLELGSGYGRSTENKGKTAVVDYSCPNVGKPLHVGHVRSTIYGDAVKRLLAASGYKAIGFNYLGDSGAQVAKLLLALKRYRDLPPITDEKSMLEYYVRINKEASENPALDAQVKEVINKIEAGDEATLEEVKRIRSLSFDAFAKAYKALGVEFDEVTGESSFINAARQVVKEIIEKKLAFRDEEGATVLRLEEHGLPNTVIARSNGTTLYLTRDIALADYKYAKYGFNLSFYATDSRQNTHFAQLFKVLELLGRPYAGKCAHKGFGFLTLQGGVISTREGRMVFLEDVVSEAVSEARKQVLARQEKKEARTGEKTTEEEASEAAQLIGVGSLKFATLRVSAEKNIEFDLRKIVSFEGDTGAYVQYSLVRCKNILRKAGTDKKALQQALKPQEKLSLNEHERRLLRTISNYPATISCAAKSFAPNIVCDYLLRLCAAFSSFYEFSPVLNAETTELRSQRLAIVAATATVLRNGLSVLGIAAPEKM